MSERRIEPEWLDHASDAEAQASLADLRWIHRWLGGRSVLGYALKDCQSGSILDVGAASGQAAIALPKARVVSLDLQLRNLRKAPRPAVCADGFRLPFADDSFDAVTCSLFLHHFENESVAALLREFARVARYRVALTDLERRWLPEHFLPATRWLFGWSALSLHDGPISVRAAFRREELEALAIASGLRHVEVKAHVPWFLLSLVATP